MRALKELTIRSPNLQPNELLQKLEATLSDGWKRDRAIEQRLQRMGVKGGNAYCFSCSAKPNRPAAALWLHARGPDELFVSSIVPQEKQELTEDEYNRFLAEFESRFLQPGTSDLGVRTELVPKRIALDHYLSLESIRRLKTFSSSANKTSLHPDDCRRWKEFIIQTHLDGTLLDPMILEEWLAAEGWPVQQRKELASEYAVARSLLATYDEERNEKCLP